MLFGFAALALFMAQSPALIPPSVPGPRVPLWYAIGGLTGGLATLVTTCPSARRSVVRAAGVPSVT
ncbi:hypothetical protein [Amycolatopsis anabasis]|uniref:hypothetical protein n=1 Tax=Amycolatopsis anabasis TaxID=1840409 RepID=UPI00131CCBBA|nr:hypothetical protein [Amycolatopsis anabasis]